MPKIMQKNPNNLIKLKKLNREKNWINQLEKKTIWFGSVLILKDWNWLNWSESDLFKPIWT
jgi:hypothetical protein